MGEAAPWEVSPFSLHCDSGHLTALATPGSLVRPP